MRQYREENIRHFVSYNACFISKKIDLVSRFVFPLILWLGIACAIYMDPNGEPSFDAKNSEPPKRIIVLIAIGVLYSLSAFLVPIICKKYKRITESEEFVYSIICHCIFGTVAIVMTSGLAFIYTTYGASGFLVSFLVVSAIDVIWAVARIKLIEGLIEEDGFNIGLQNDKFIRFDCTNRRLWESTTIVTAPLLGCYFLMKHSGLHGIAFFGFLLELAPIIMIDVCVCCMLQIKYARAYNMQDILPTKPRKEAEQELAYGSRNNETKQK